MSENEEHVKGLQDYITIVRRGKRAILLSLAAALAIALVVAALWPPTYQSKATILIEQQRIPRDLVKTTVGTYAAQQIQTINARVLTVQNINEIVENYNIFDQAEADTRLPRTVVADMFREQMDLSLVSANLVDPKSGRAIEVTIAFSLAFEDASASRAQQVVNELITLFLNENLRDRASQASSTEEFFVLEAERLDVELRELEQQLAEFKAENEGSLPELQAFNVQMLEKAQRELLDTELRIRELERRKIELASQLVQITPSAPTILATGEVVMSDADRLKSLLSDYRRKSAIYSEDHPDVLQLKRKIEELQKALGVGTDLNDLREQLNEQSRLLAELKAKYRDEHQEVVQAQRTIDLLKNEIDSAIEEGVEEYEPEADNPAYILLDTQIKSADTEIESLRLKAVELEQRRVMFEERLAMAPHVDKEYQAILRDYTNAKNKYQDIRSKQREASVAKNLEEGRQGERYTLIEPPPLPEEPISPNRMLIVVAGIVVGLVIGLGIVMVRAVLFGGINGARELGAIMGEAPLVAIGYIDNEEDIAKKHRFWKVVAAGGAVSAVALVLFVHFFHTPLDVLFFSLTGN